MKPIFYRCTKNNECFKLVMEDGIHLKQIDACIDAMTEKQMEFISEEEFEQSADKFMDLDVLDTTDTYKIAVLSTKWIDLENMDYL